jgi:hypothetical protein
VKKLHNFYTTLFLLFFLTNVPSSFADGRVRFVRLSDPGLDVHTNAPTSSVQQWFRDKFWRMAVFQGYFDSRTSWYPNGLVYINAYAIYPGSDVQRTHPEWILKDASGNLLFIPWGCASGTCPQFAADISNPAFRRWWIDTAKHLMQLGYRGLFIDDVNMEFRVGDGAGRQVAPLNRSTGAAMTWTEWRKYMCEFMEQIRLEVPNAEILHNSIWYAGGEPRDNDPYIQRQIRAANFVNIEHGVNDTGLTGGTGPWSLSALHSFIDRVHERGTNVVLNDFGESKTELEYALANYHLVNNGGDAVGNMQMNPTNWFAGYDTSLGTPTGARTTWSGLLRRDFQAGLVLVNAPDSPARTVTLPGTYRKIDGAAVTTVTLGAKQGIVLTLVSKTPPPPAPSPTQPATSYLSDLTYRVIRNGYGPAEKDRSNGEAGAGDGRPLKLAGVSYSKGIGVHAASEITYDLNGKCSTFTAKIGVDDEIPSTWPASVVFQVWADGAKLYSSPTMTAASATRGVQVSLTGRSKLSLIVTDAGDGPNSDHADWASAQITCSK